MKRSTITAVFVSLFSMLLWSCSKESKSTQVSPNIPSVTYNYPPDHKDRIVVVLWPHVTGGNPVRDAAGGTITSLKGIAVTNSSVTLGRVIFYDNSTTINISNNCNGCHSAPPNGNKLSVVKHSDTELAAIHAQAGIESPDRLVEKMLSKTYYTQLFKDAYGTSDITPERIIDALSEYMTAMSSVPSPEALAADPRFSDPFK